MTMTINGSSGLIFPDGSGQETGIGRNRIINGDMRIDQRNAGASGTASAFTIDRWGYGASQASKGTWQQNAGSVTPPTGFQNYWGFTSSSAYSVTASDQFYFYQGIEGYNVADLGLGASGASTFTISFWVRSSLTGTFGGSVQNGAQTRSYPFSYTISSANTWEQKSVTIVGDTTGTWLKTNSTGMYLLFSLGMGSTYSGTANTWAGANYIAPTGATSVVGTNGATFYITGVQLEVGSTATPFERRLYNQELANCQRYYLRLNGGAQTAYTSFGVGVAYSTTSANMTVNYPVQMRSKPTYNYGGSLRMLGGGGGMSVTASSLGDTSYLSSYVVVTVASGLSAGNAYWFGPNGDTTAYIDFSSEL
jgi:hypothetical protein